VNYILWLVNIKLIKAYKVKRLAFGQRIIAISNRQVNFGFIMIRDIVLSSTVYQAIKFISNNKLSQFSPLFYSVFCGVKIA